MLAWLLALWSLAGVLRGPGLLRRANQALSTVLLLVIALFFSAIVVLYQAFHAFAGETLIARVATTRLSPETFQLTYTPLQEDAPFPLRVTLRGDQWAISGGIVKWHPWLTALGVPSYHRPTRLSGQFSNLKRQQAARPSLAALEPATDWLWEALYRAAPYLPFIEAAYGSSAYVYVEPDTTHDVYVSQFGYLIKRR